MLRPDLVILKEGRPVAVVEAKARPVSPSFREAVLHQLRSYSVMANSPWSVLVDPETVRIFGGYDVSRPLAILSTEELLAATQLSEAMAVGERTLLLAVDRWLRDLPKNRNTLTRHPELVTFSKDLADGITSTEEWSPGPSRER